MNNLIYKHEEPLFYISIAVSSMLWLMIVFGTLGIALIYALLFFIFYLFMQSGFISHLKGSAVKITEQQFPDLYERVRICCDKLGMSPQPSAYLLHGDGIFNAFATRFLGRNFIVLYSDVVDALEENPDALNFYIGHELGHIHRKHLTWGPLLWPSGMMPLIGAAYSRAREYTCDRYGSFCCEKRESAADGLAALAAGEKRWRTINLRDYAMQASESGGFWMSFHELTADYPWLVKRVGEMMPDEHIPSPRRHWFAWCLAAITPRFGGGGATSLLMTVAIIGILAAIAIPEFATYRTLAHTSAGLAEAKQVAEAFEGYYYEHQGSPGSLQELGFEEMPAIPGVERLELRDHGVIAIIMSSTAVAGKSFIYEARVDDEGKLFWVCSSEEIDGKNLPEECRP